MDPVPPTTQKQHEMSLMEHLTELRNRLIYCTITILVGASVSYVYAGEIFNLLSAPYFESFGDSILIGTGPADAFILKLKMAVIAGTIITSPVLFFQVWAFISPGLLPAEKRLVIPFVLLSTILFLLGIWFAYRVVLPFSFEFFFNQYTSINITPTVRITEHISFMIKALISFGVVFEMPILAYFLGRVGIVTSDMLVNGFRYAVVAIFIISAVMTPPDVLTQFLMALPLLVLYGISILIVRFTEKRPSSGSENHG